MTTRLLSLDHCRIDALLADVKRRAAAGNLPRAAAQFVEFRRTLERHIRVEEELVFPRFERLTRVRAAGPLEVMRLEHQLIRRLLPSIGALLETDDVKARTTGLADLTVRLLAHHRKEDRILYPMIDRATAGAGGSLELAHQIEAQLGDRP